MIKSRRKSAGDQRHGRRIQTPFENEDQSLTEPEDAGSDASRKLGAKGKPEDAMPVKAGGQTEGRSGRSMADESRRVGWKVKSEDAIPDEESEAGLEGRAGGARFSTQVGGRVRKVKLEGSIAGASWRSGSKAGLEG